MLVARSGLGAVRFWNRVPLHARSAAAGHGRRLRRLLYRPYAGRWRTAVGLRCAERQPSAGRHLSRRHRRFRLVATGTSGSGSHTRALLRDHRAAHSEHFVQALPGRRRCRVGRHSQGRRLPRGENLGVNESVMWGEYFFVEALDEVLRESAGRLIAG